MSTFNMHNRGRRISRVVVHPSYRGCGIGKELVRRYIRDYPETDVIAAMAMYNPIFERAGMKRIEDSVILPPNGIKEYLNNIGFDERRWGDKSYLDSIVENENVRNEISKYAKAASAVICPGGVRASNEEAEKKIKYDKKTASRVLFFFRPRKMAHYISK